MRNRASDEWRRESKERLTRILDTKLRTAFIGAISSFEQYFGFLWESENSQITDEQRQVLTILAKAGFDFNYFNDMWYECRNKALTNGNNQIRGMKQEMQQNTIQWERYQMNLPIIPEKKED